MTTELKILTHDLKNELLALGLSLKVIKGANESGIKKLDVLIEHALESQKRLEKIALDLSKLI